MSKRLLIAAGIVVVAGTAVGASSVGAAEQQPTIAIAIDSPAAGARLKVGPVEIQGHITGGHASEVTSVLFAVDVSGSTASPNGNDCNGDGKSTADDDYNTDKNAGDTLDCEISAVASVDGSLRGVPQSSKRLSVALVPFGNSAAAASLNEAGAHFVAPGTTGDKKSTTPNLLYAAGSMRQGSIAQYSPAVVGTGTNFDAAVTTSLDTLKSAAPGPKWIFFLSDGQASVSNSTLDSLRTSGVHLRSFAVGSGASCDSSSLKQLSDAGGEQCIKASNPSSLAADVLAAKPADIDRIDVSIAGRTLPARIDSVGNWSVTTKLGRGTYDAVATAHLTGGGTRVAKRHLVVSADYSYVALGDSYSAGEGARPYYTEDALGNVDRNSIGFLCHRSKIGYPSLITIPGRRTPIAQDPRAAFTNSTCSGARIVNLDTSEQYKTSGSRARHNARQYDSLSANTDLVTVTIGGNDVAFAEVIKHCSTHANCQDDTFITVDDGTGRDRKVSLREWVDARLVLIQNELSSVYRTIVRRAPHATIIVATYPHLLKTGSANLCLESKALGNSERQYLSNAVDRLDAAIARSADQSGVQVADVRAEFAGHSICDHDDWINGATARTSYYDIGTGFPPIGDGAFHPNARGQRAYADVIDRVLAPRAGRFVAREAAPSFPNAGPIGSNHAPAAASPQLLSASDRTSSSASSVSVTPSTKSGGADRARPSSFVRRDVAAEAQSPRSNLLRAIARTTIADVTARDLVHRNGGESCPERVVANEVVPVVGGGFAAGTGVRVRLIRDGLAAIDVGSLVANHLGAVRGSVVIPRRAAPTVAPRMLRIQLDGRNLAGAPAVGSTMILAGGSVRCERLARMGHAVLGDVKNAPQPVLSAARPHHRDVPVHTARPGQGPVSLGAPDEVAATGAPELYADTIHGVMLVAGGLLILAAGKRRRTRR